MRYDLQQWARGLDLRPPSLKVMLVYLASRANKENCCWPGQKTICSDTGYRKSTVQRGLGELEELGYIRRVKRNINRQGPRSDLIYVLGPARPEQETRCTSAAEKPKRQDAEANKGTPQIGGRVPPKRRGAHPKLGPLYKEELSDEISQKCARAHQPAAPGNHGKVLVELDSPEWRAWQTYLRTVLGKPGSTHTTLTTDDGRLINGWRFTSRWPPGHELFEEAAE